MKMNAKKKLLITGAQGFVAGSVLAQAGDEWEVHALSRTTEPAGSVRKGNQSGRADSQWHVCDPLAPGKLAQLFREVRPLTP